MKKTQSGRSMVEMLGVLAIVGVLSLGGIAGYTKAMEVYKKNRTMNLIKELVVGIRNATFQDANIFKYEGIDNEKLISSNIVDKDLLIQGNIHGHKLINPFHGDLEVDNSEQNLSFIISIDKIPFPACLDIAISTWDKRDEYNLYSMKIESERYYVQDEDSVNLEKAMEACAEESKMTFEFQ